MRIVVYSGLIGILYNTYMRIHCQVVNCEFRTFRVCIYVQGQLAF